jgi:hypothetical protein
VAGGSLGAFDYDHSCTMTASLAGAKLSLDLRDEVTGATTHIEGTDATYSQFRHVTVYGGEWIDPMQYSTTIDEVTFISD